MDDYIRREAAKAQIRKAYTRIEDRVAINCVLNDVPAANVAPVRHGRWMETEQPCGWSEVACAECSECGEDFVLGEYSMADLRSLFRYCPNCGAQMDETLGALDETLQRVENTLDALDGGADDE